MEKDIQTFRLVGAREVMPSGAQYFERIIDALENAVMYNHGLAFDLSRTLIESACKTIIVDRGHEYNGKEELPTLIKSTLDLVSVIPEDIDEPTKAKEAIKHTINGLLTSVQGICELRNLFGEASHGRDAYFSQLETDHALMVARSADVIVNYLFRMHKAYPDRYTKTRLLYGVNNVLNDWIDEQNDAVRIFDFEYKPSEVLFNIDRVAYQELLSSYESDKLPEENPTDIKAQGSNSDE